MRTITVKGTGKASAKPDYVSITLNLKTIDKNYEKASAKADKEVEVLREAFVTAGFKKDELKTTNFDVGSVYESKKDRNGEYKQVFAGYRVCHDLKLSFDFTMENLSKALKAIAGSSAKPEFSIRFSVKDPSDVGEAVLQSATENARKKAEIICNASGMHLGEIQSIDYDWGEVNIYSDTRYNTPIDMVCDLSCNYDIEPDDIEVCDSIRFVWEIS